MTSQRRGATVVEALVAFLAAIFILILLADLARRQVRLAATLTAASEQVEFRRVVRDLLSREAAGGGLQPVVGAVAHVRSHVGWAVPCAPGVWRYRGRRRPDPRRDSVWVVREDGVAGRAALVRVGNGDCGTVPRSDAADPTDSGGRPLVLVLSDSTVAGAVLRVYERGRYTLTDALRYGRSGVRSQPLTAPVADPTRTGFTVTESGLAVRLQGVDDSLRLERSWPIW